MSEQNQYPGVHAVWGIQGGKEIFAALTKAQSEFPVVEKTATNPFFRNKYAAFETIVTAVRPVLFKHGLGFTQTTDTEDGSNVLVTTVFHSSGQFIVGRYFLTPIKNDPQSVGSSLSYAKRYALAAILGVVTTGEDDDAEVAHGRGEATAKTEAAEGSETTVLFVPTKTDSKSGVNKTTNKPWTKYFVYDDKTEYSTFDKEVFEQATAAFNTTTEVEVTYTKTKFGLEITYFKIPQEA